MKKITTLLLATIAAMISCKKEKQTITKIDPQTGKTTTIEIPSDSIKEVIVVPAIKDSLGIYKQSFKLEKGETYPLVILQQNKQSIIAPNGETQSGTSENRDEMTFTVNDVKDGIYDISINLVRKKSTQTINGETVSIDTKAVEPKNEQLKTIYKVQKALVGNSLQMKMKENGDVISITGFDPIYKKINDAIAKTIKETRQKKEIENSFKQSFSETFIKDQLAQNLKLIPSKGIKIGETWTKTENASPNGGVKLTTTYKLLSVGNGIAKISVRGGIPKKTNKNTQNGITHSMSSELSRNGTITLDQNTGWVLKQNINIETNQSEIMSDGKQSQTIKSRIISTVKVNP